MTTQSIEKFRELFAQEAGVRLGRLNQLLLQLECEGGEAATIDNLLREVHTPKGSAAVVGFDALSRFAHGLEERLGALRNGSPLTPPVVDDLRRPSTRSSGWSQPRSRRAARRGRGN